MEQVRSPRVRLFDQVRQSKAWLWMLSHLDQATAQAFRSAEVILPKHFKTTQLRVRWNRFGKIIQSEDRLGFIRRVTVVGEAYTAVGSRRFSATVTSQYSEPADLWQPGQVTVAIFGDSRQVCHILNAEESQRLSYSPIFPRKPRKSTKTAPLIDF